MNLLTLRYFFFQKEINQKNSTSCCAAWFGGKLLGNGAVLKRESNGCVLSAALVLGVAPVGYRNSSRALLLLQLQIS